MSEKMTVSNDELNACGCGCTEVTFSKGFPDYAKVVIDLDCAECGKPRPFKLWLVGSYIIPDKEDE